MDLKTYQNSLRPYLIILSLIQIGISIPRWYSGDDYKSSFYKKQFIPGVFSLVIGSIGTTPNYVYGSAILSLVFTVLFYTGLPDSEQDLKLLFKKPYYGLSIGIFILYALLSFYTYKISVNENLNDKP